MLIYHFLTVAKYVVEAGVRFVIGCTGEAAITYYVDRSVDAVIPVIAPLSGRVSN